MSESKQRYCITVRSGSWLHSDAVPHEVLIVRQNFDSYWEEESKESPEKLNEHGEVFHVQFCRDGAVQSTSPAFMSLGEAVAHAAEKVSSPIHWDGGSGK